LIVAHLLKYSSDVKVTASLASVAPQSHMMYMFIFASTDIIITYAKLALIVIFK